MATTKQQSPSVSLPSSLKGTEAGLAITKFAEALGIASSFGTAPKGKPANTRKPAARKGAPAKPKSATESSATKPMAAYEKFLATTSDPEGLHEAVVNHTSRPEGITRKQSTKARSLYAKVTASSPVLAD